MGLTRRQFMKWASVTGVGAVIFNGCRVPDHEIQIQSSVELPEDLVTGRDNYYATVAAFGGGSEGLLVRVMEGRAKKVEGNPEYPMNRGKHHIRSETLLQALYHPDRIKSPLVRIAKGGPFRRIGWPEALQRLATLLGETDPSSVLIATAPERGRLADVINGFAKGYGAAVLGFDPMDQTVLRAAMKRVYDQDALPDFDIANASYVLSFGADFLGTWMDPTHFMRGYGEFRQGHEHRGRLVHVDSRFSLTAAAADDWVYANPGTEGLLAMAMVHTIIGEGLGDRSAANALTGGRPNVADAFSASNAAGPTGVSEARIKKIAMDFAGDEHGQALAIGGGAAAAHTNGLFNLTAIYALNHLVGGVNRPGGIIFNPPSMHSNVPAAPLREWQAALERMSAGEVKVLLHRDANIAYGLPGVLKPGEALDGIETIVSFSSFLDETTARADLILPGHTPLEQWGTDAPDPGPGYPTIAFQQPVVNRFRDTIAFGDVLLVTARSLDVDGDLPWSTMRDAVRATAQELRAKSDGSVQRELPAGVTSFEEFWKRALEIGAWLDDKATVPTRDITPPRLPDAPQLPDIDGGAAGDKDRYDLYLVPFEGHGIGAGQFAHLPWAQAVPDPITTATWTTWVSLNPVTADKKNLHQDDVVSVEGPTGASIRAVVYVSPGTPPDVAEVPFGQGHEQMTRYASGRGANLWEMLSPRMDTETGAMAWAATRVRLVKSNKRQSLPTLEGLEVARQLPHEPVILVSRSNGDHAHGA
jgi:anaerobic selenocysteine-containing dehydrogenase